MGDGSSPYAVLGLQPGASRAAVDQAYRRLIKQHHPDRKGGDPVRASALNRAYAALKDGEGSSPLSLAVSRPARTRNGQRWWPALLFLAAVAAGAGAFAIRWVPPGTFGAVSSAVPPPSPPPPASQQLPHELQLDRRAVSSGVAEALRFAREGQWDEARAYCASCASDLERLRSLALVDHCVAFERTLQLLRPGVSRTATQQQLQVARALTQNRVLAQSRIDLARRSAEMLLFQKQSGAQR